MEIFYSVADLRENLSAAIGKVRYGNDVIIITHHGSPVAKIVDIEGKENPKAKLHPKQIPPDDDPDWIVYILAAGRGAGKTLAGASWILKEAAANPGRDFAAIGSSFGMVQRVMFEGPSGIIRQAGEGVIASYVRNALVIHLTNNTRILGFSAKNGDDICGTNLSGAWCDEIASFTDEGFYRHCLLPRLRIERHGGGFPRMMITTTPKFTKLMKELFEASKKRGDYLYVQMDSRENPLVRDDLSERLREQYGQDTVLWKQEVEGEFIEFTKAQQEELLKKLKKKKESTKDAADPHCWTAEFGTEDWGVGADTE